MRPKHLVFGILSIATTSIACSQALESNDSSQAAAGTEEDLAKTALRNLGAKLPGAEGNCNQCHDINKATLRLWADSYAKTVAFLKDETKTVDQRIDFM